MIVFEAEDCVEPRYQLYCEPSSAFGDGSKTAEEWSEFCEELSCDTCMADPTNPCGWSRRSQSCGVGYYYAKEGDHVDYYSFCHPEHPDNEDDEGGEEESAESEENTGGEEDGESEEGDEEIEECKTVDDEDCIFPFTYDGVVYDGCTIAGNSVVNRNRHWCATAVDEDGVYTEWGRCNEYCQDASEDESSSELEECPVHEYRELQNDCICEADVETTCSAGKFCYGGACQDEAVEFSNDECEGGQNNVGITCDYNGEDGFCIGHLKDECREDSEAEDCDAPYFELFCEPSSAFGGETTKTSEEWRELCAELTCDSCMADPTYPCGWSQRDEVCGVGYYYAKEGDHVDYYSLCHPEHPDNEEDSGEEIDLDACPVHEHRALEEDCLCEADIDTVCEADQWCYGGQCQTEALQFADER